MDKLSYLYIFFQSNLLEVPVYYFIYLVLLKNKISFVETCKLTTVINLITHPIVFFVIMTAKIPYIISILLAESFAIVTESILHRRYLKERAIAVFIAATIANLFSWQLAPLLTYFFFY